MRITTLIKGIHHQVRTYAKSDIIINEGESYNSILLLVEGTVCSEMMSAEGQILTLEHMEAPSTLAPAFIFAAKPHIPVTLVAQTECKIVVFSKDSLTKLFSLEPIIMHNFLQIISNRVLFLTNKVKLLQFNNLRAKIAQFLLQTYQSCQTTEFTLPKTQQQLADLLGVARPSVGRVFRELHAEDVIFAKGKKVKINDIKLLKSFVK